MKSVQSKKQIDTLAKKTVAKSEIVSETLCDDVLQRLSPFLLRNKPVDILDLWPGAGLLSSKVHDLVRPRRHVLIEPEIKTFRPVLESLVKSRNAYSLLSMDIKLVEDWKQLLATCLPDDPDTHSDGYADAQDAQSNHPRANHSLLVLASPPPSVSKKDHFTPARWCAMFMDTCMRATGLHSYGQVRLLVSLPPADSQAVLARTTSERKRPALLTESVARHAFEVAAPSDPSLWITFKGWDLVAANAARVAQRTIEQGIIIPAGRELPPVAMAPDSPDPGRMAYPYVPRPRTPLHDRLLNVLDSEEERIQSPQEDSQTQTSKKRTTKKAIKNPKRLRACIVLNQENRHAYARQELSKQHATLDELTRLLSCAAADPHATATTLQPLQDRIDALRRAIADEYAQHHYEATKQLPIAIDDHRAAMHSGNFDNAYLPWDRRPFEPLLIHPDEQYPRDVGRALVYFEPDDQSTALRQLHRLPPDEREHPVRLFQALSLALGSRGNLTVAELLQAVFPRRSVNDLVRAVPSLATFAAKSLPVDFDVRPKTVHGAPDQPQPLDPAVCYQENLDYDLTDVRVRSLSAATLLDICLEYQRSGQKVSVTQLNRMLGGTLTSFRSGGYLIDT
ncbi:uncharacterized protein ATNIH1004_007396 [Aspergillus tanneri]|uniref:rRNA adenine N(6)-methyltransferase n=1 Tax=Aspergillus tanneri TaxID=1220188 RepID=A0A5M9MG87_9EURO|nr:uncharacterized protein ATNIH1004_007396 [Aspergillus tanneri]KAA8645975.1 hypothetical protein ATNIH1004_007396 [Aspergillus tanneri]